MTLLGLWQLIQPYLNAIESALLSLVPGFQAVYQYFQPGNPNSWANKVLNNTTAAVSDLESGTHGLAAITATLTDIQAAIVALGGPQQATLPVILPTTPPAGYGGTLSGSDVWDTPLGVASIAAGDLLIATGTNILFEANGQVLKETFYPGGWYVSGDWGFDGGTEPNVNWPPVVDPGTILVSDATVAAWLAREYGFSPDGVDAYGRPFTNQPTSSWQWTYKMGTAEFAAYKAAVFGVAPATIGGLPLWPGASEVTLSGPFDYSANFTLFQDMSGALITVDSVPTGAQYFDYPAFRSYRHVGGVSFQSDHGDWELPQPLGPDTGIYTPRTMTKAVACSIHPYQGVSGTITSFLPIS